MYMQYIMCVFVCHRLVIKLKFFVGYGTGVEQGSLMMIESHGQTNQLRDINCVRDA